MQDELRKRLLALLADIEWSAGGYDSWNCPACGAEQGTTGHRPDCELADLMRELDKPDAIRDVRRMTPEEIGHRLISSSKGKMMGEIGFRLPNGTTISFFEDDSGGWTSEMRDPFPLYADTIHDAPESPQNAQGGAEGGEVG